LKKGFKKKIENVKKIKLPKKGEIEIKKACKIIQNNK